MSREDICLPGQIFAEDERLILSRYTENDKPMYMLMLDEIMEEYPTMNQEYTKNRFWREALKDTNSLKLKIVEKETQAFVGEVEVMKLDSEMPELGINLLRAYWGQGLGTRATKLFVDRLKQVISVEAFSLTICSDNYVSQRLAKELGAVKVGDERDKGDDAEFIWYENTARITEIEGNSKDYVCKYFIYYRL